MAIVALVHSDSKRRSLYLESRGLPVHYMGDFSVMGFVVDHYREAFDLLQKAGYQLSRRGSGADILISSPRQCAEIRALMIDNDIACDFSDIADTLYQA